jgi:hypothetical protein
MMTPVIFYFFSSVFLAADIRIDESEVCQLTQLSGTTLPHP